MKLYNKTRIPDSVLESLLSAAGRVAHARTTNVVVIVNPCRSKWSWCSGIAHRARGVARATVATRSFKKDGDIKQGFVATDGGYFTITLPVNSTHDSLANAENFFAVAAHEWVHIKQYQEGYHFDRAERKKRHDNRPWEQQANKVMSAACKKLSTSRQDAIIALALEFEKAKK